MSTLNLFSYATKQITLYHNDLRTYGNGCKGVYRGITWDMSRIPSGHWAAKITITLPIDDDTYKKMEAASHRGKFDTHLGFVCNSSNDFPAAAHQDVSGNIQFNSMATYRRYDYVVGKILDIIDVYCDELTPTDQGPELYRLWEPTTHKEIQHYIHRMVITKWGSITPVPG